MYHGGVLVSEMHRAVRVTGSNKLAIVVNGCLLLCYPICVLSRMSTNFHLMMAGIDLSLLGDPKLDMWKRGDRGNHAEYKFV